jgi:phosphoglycolate phosphatase-like HAD superfamily hydrolase
MTYQLDQRQRCAPAAVDHDAPLVPALPVGGFSQRPALGRVRAVILDVEGTLVDSVLPTLCAWQDVLSDHGYCFTTSELHRYSGLAAPDLLAAVLPPTVPDAVRRAIAVRQRDIYLAKYIARVRAFDGVGGLIRELAAEGFCIALATSCDRKLLNHYLALIDCPQDALDAIVCGKRAIPAKPDPRALELAVKRLSLPAAQVVAVGDTPFDAQAAVRAGVQPIGVLTGYFSRPTLAAAGCCDVFDDAAALLRQLIAATATDAAEADRRQAVPSA